MRRTEALPMRQARVGIIANPATVRVPVHLPRDVWSRWPDMRSRRRYNARERGGGADQPEDPVLDGRLLGAFARDMRAGKCDGKTRTAGFGAPPDIARMGAPPRRWVALLCLAIVIAAAIGYGVSR
ncbi:hypothetical protein [Roseinatronobacter alkalisoli]|uniref:Uncharacterized protein n=1 Tax=Roseinatronobacter alkalisoli TaxID=3028235 RepID=A0ABT5T8V0_9RHOB|nr:hypothetical protein [Roseinatronobacter sp. HJB301]MDD7971547.1 hypothetical protein [Roseinatronobacter sp. HJB301]